MSLENSIIRGDKLSKLKAYRVAHANIPSQLQYTIKEIGKGITAGSQYPPIIKYAQRVASRAGPKDYLGQVRELYNDFTKRWRYVLDTLGLEVVHVSGPAIYGEILGFSRKNPREHGAGDCDDAATAMGALLQAIGIPIRIVTTNPPYPRGRKSLFTHVFVQAKVPRMGGWVTVDPVGHPEHEFGWTPPHSRAAFWNTTGNLVGTSGHWPANVRRLLSGDDDQGGPEMYGLQGVGEFQDYGLGSFAGDGEPADWAVEGLLGFGAYSPTLGIISGPQLLMEYDEDDELPINGVGYVRTKMLEMSPEDYRHVRSYGMPRMGAVALSDDGDVYQYVRDGYSGLGFFKKLFRRAKKFIGKGIRWVGKKAKKLISKLPGGKYLVKLHNKIHKVAMKIARPLTKFVGKFAKKLAPIAALIPGYGPAIAAGLYTAGRIAKVLRDTGVVTDKKGRPKFKSGKQAKVFQERLNREAQRLKREKKGGRRRPRSRRGGRLLRVGTPEHAAYLGFMGFDINAVQ